ncbi:MAG: glutathione transferase [Myxococcales bacterium]|nr:glutathione transferase [Myxococcales bacterium]
MEPLILHIENQWISPYAMSAFVALEEKQLPFTVRELSLAAGEQRSPDYHARTGRIPALQHGDFWLAESQAIVEYLADIFPYPAHPRLFPEDLRQRAICREVMAWVRSDLMPIREERPTSTVWGPPADKPLSARAQEAVARLVRYCDPLISEGRTTLFADWCIADVDLSLMLQRLHHSGDALPAKLAAYAEANWQRPSIQRWCSRAAAVK